MRKLSWVLLLLLSYGSAHAQTAWNMALLGHFNDTSMQKVSGDQIWNDVTGWKDSVTGREYMIAGNTDSIYFFDVTDPTNIVMCDREDGVAKLCINRDYATYQHYVYCVSDQNFGALQIFDLQYLPDSVHKVYQSDTLGANTHTIFIDAPSKRMYMCSNKFKPFGVSPMDIISLEDPLHPVRIGRLVPPSGSFSHVHEVYARHDTVYCSAGNAGLYIYDARDASNLIPLGSVIPPYPQNAYNHSSWLDSSGKYILFCDETPAGVGMKLYDLTDISEPRIVGDPFKAEGSPHNAYWMGRYAYASTYYGGVQVYDMENDPSPDLVAFYDTYPIPYTDSYRGCWGVWPFLPSGNILASDMSFGLFVLRLSPDVGLNESLTVQKLHAYPNPFAEQITIQVPSEISQQGYLSVYDLQGKIAVSKNIPLVSGLNEIPVTEAATLQNGLYIFVLTTQNGVYSNQFLKQ